MKVYVPLLWVHDVVRTQFLKIKVTAFREPAVLIRLPVLFKTCEDTSPTIIRGRRLGGTTRPIFK